MKRVKRGQEVNKKIFEPSIFFFILSNPEFFLSGKCQVIGRWHTIGLPLPEAASEKYFFCILFYSTFLSQKNLFRKRFFLRRDFDFLEEKRCQRRRTRCNPEVHWRVQVLKINAKHSYFTNPHTLYLSLSLPLTPVSHFLSHIQSSPLSKHNPTFLKYLRNLFYSVNLLLPPLTLCL